MPKQSKSANATHNFHSHSPVASGESITNSINKDHSQSMEYPMMMDVNIKNINDIIERNYSKNGKYSKNNGKNNHFIQIDHEVDGDIVEEEQCQGISDLKNNQIEKLSLIVTNLVTKNKVNAKNAFQVPLIDVTSLTAIKKNDDNAWSKISNVLENSSKIYGFRVDFMADVITKMTNNIQRSQITQQINNPIKARNNNNVVSGQSVDYSILQSIDLQQYQSQLQEVCLSHLQKQKTINQSVEQQNTHICTNFQQSARRMFDQNGLSGLLLARLPVSKDLNIIIDPNINYSTRNKLSQKRAQSNIEIAKPKPNLLSIFSQISVFSRYCHIPYTDDSCYEVQMQDCCNLNFEDQPQQFRYDIEENPQQMLEINEPNAREEGTYPQLSNQLNFHIKSNSPFETCSFSNFSIAIEPFCEKKYKEQEVNNRNQKNYKNDKLDIKEKPRRLRAKIQRNIFEVKFEVQAVPLDKNAILSIKKIDTNQQSNTSRRKIKDKHLTKVFLPEFKIQKQLSMAPVHLQSPLLSFDGRTENFNLMGCNFQDYNSQNICSLYFIHATQNDRALLSIPNIKITKAWLWGQLSSTSSIPFAQLHETYEKTQGHISEAVLFLATLHVANQKNLTISQQNDNDIYIKNPHAPFT